MSNWEVCRPHLHGAYHCVPRARAVFPPTGMHRCSMHPHAGNPIDVFWDTGAALAQPLLPIWHPFGCWRTAPNAHRTVHTNGWQIGISSCISIDINTFEPESPSSLRGFWCLEAERGLWSCDCQLSRWSHDQKAANRKERSGAFC